MKIRNFKINKAFLTSLFLTPTLMLSGCGMSECGLNEYHLHKYEKDGIVRYIDSEWLDYDGYSWTDEVVYADINDKDLYKFEKKKDLIKIEDNVDYIINTASSHDDFLEYRYSYSVPHVMRVGKTNVVYYTTSYSWTSNPEHHNLTGDVRMCRYVYTGYKVEKNDNDKYVLIPSESSENVNDIIKNMEEYPYMEEKFYKAIVISTGEEADYEDGKAEEDVNDMSVVDDENKVYQKSN